MSRTPLCMPTHERKWITILQASGSDRDNGCQAFSAMASGFLSEFIVDGIAIFRTLLFEKVEGPSPNLLAVSFKSHNDLPGERSFAESFTPFGQSGMCFGHRRIVNIHNNSVNSMLILAIDPRGRRCQHRRESNAASRCRQH